MTAKTRRYWTPARILRRARESLQERLEYAQSQVAASVRSDVEYYRGQVSALTVALSLIDETGYRRAEAEVEARFPTKEVP